MTTFSKIPEQVEEMLDKHAGASRRDFLRQSGMLVVGVAAAANIGPLADVVAAQQAAAPRGVGPYPDVDFHQLDSWIVIRQDSTATFYVGKTDPGQGTGTAFRQMMADELDIAFDKTSCIMGTTDITVDQGGSGGSDAIQTDGPPMRRVAAEARRVLLEMGSQRLGVPVDQLAVANGVISLKTDANRRVTYGELIGDRKFNVTLTGENINNTTGIAKVKPVQELKIVGQSPQRYDIPAKVDGTLKWAVDVKLPGMVHARHVRPPMVGAKLVSVDETSIKDVPGVVKVVTRGNYVAVVCEREEHAVRAARQLKVNWEKPATAPMPTSEGLFDYMRSAKQTRVNDPNVTGDPDAAFKAAASTVEASYEVPFQGHTSFGPAHALADPSNDQLTIYSNDMKTYGMRVGLAEFLKIPRDRIRVVYMEGPQAYGRTAAEDAGFEAAFLATELKRPVRVQWSRQEETAWDTKGPAYAVKMRGGLDGQGNPQAWEYDARSVDYSHLGYNDANTVLISQLFGTRSEKPAQGNTATPSDTYGIPNRRYLTSVVSMPLAFETPIRTGNLRDPNGPQVTFASESFIDELAAAAKADPVQFRLKLFEQLPKDDGGFRRARSIAVVKAAAQTFGWDTRPSPSQRGTGPVLTGRGIGYAFRGQTVVAQIAEVDVNRQTGRVWVKRLVVAHDCGLVINPEGLRRTVENGAMYALSRALHEEVQFDTEKVTSVDWVSSPTLRHSDAPAKIDIVIVNGDPNPNRPDLPHYGAGEAVCKPMLAAVANAIFDATGVRLRRVPFRSQRVLAALKAANV